MKKLIKITALTLAIIMMASVPSFAKTLYSIDGRTIDVHQSEVNAYLNVGWYQAPVTIMYSEDDRTIVVYESEVEAYEKVGWTDGKEMITIYAPPRRVSRIPRSQRTTYLNLGWHKQPIYSDDDFYEYTSIPKFEKVSGGYLINTYTEDNMYIMEYYCDSPDQISNYLDHIKQCNWIYTGRNTDYLGYADFFISFSPQVPQIAISRNHVFNNRVFIVFMPIATIPFY